VNQAILVVRARKNVLVRTGKTRIELNALMIYVFIAEQPIKSPALLILDAQKAIF
jgi:hypothetical protein